LILLYSLSPLKERAKRAEESFRPVTPNNLAGVDQNRKWDDEKDFAFCQNFP
jgi:hypothetical protein